MTSSPASMSATSDSVSITDTISSPESVSITSVSDDEEAASPANQSAKEISPLTETWDDDEWEIFLKKFHARFGYTNDEIQTQLPNPNDPEFTSLVKGLRNQQKNNAPVEPFLEHLRTKKLAFINKNKRQRSD